MAKKLFPIGSLVAMITPMRKQRLDGDALQALVERQVLRGSTGLVVCGSTGEAALLAPEEQQQVIRLVVDAAGGRVPVIAGVSATATDMAVALARQAEKARADAVMIAAPSYIMPSQEGIYWHCRRVNDNCGLPVMLYDVPRRAGVAIDDDTILRLSDLARVMALKDAGTDLGRVSRLRRRLDEGFRLYSGNDDTQAAFRAEGGDGAVSVVGNIAPMLCAALHRAWAVGDIATFSKHRDRLSPLSRSLGRLGNPAGVKRALFRLGLIANELRAPLLPVNGLDDDMQADLEPVWAAEETTARRQQAPMTVMTPSLARHVV